MTLEERCRLSYYREETLLNAAHNVVLVRHSESGQLFVRKTLVNYQLDIFRGLIDEPVPNMPRIIEAVEDEGRLIVIETYLAGRTLQDLLNERGTLPTAGICRIGAQLCRILSSLHERGIIHRDIKPSNIILSEGGVVKLLDLDTAKVYRSEESRDTKLIGTHGYAAPEQYGFGASSLATDIYAVGALLSVMATGEFPGIKTASDEGLCEVIKRCTRLDPEERYRSAEELAEALEAVPLTAEERKGKRHEAPKGTAPRKHWKNFLPPGFRSGNIWKILLSFVWYLTVFMLAISFLISPPEGSTRFDSFAEFCLTLVGGISMPLFLFNYRGIWHKIHIDRIRSPFGRRAAAVCCSAVLTFVCVFILAAIGAVLISMGLIPPE